MRGEPTSIKKKKVDIILSEARYAPDGDYAQLLRGYARRGVVWGDWQLFQRKQILDEIAGGRKIYTGRPAELEGDFELIAPVSVVQLNGSSVLRAEGVDGPGDALDLPIF
jgi:hypothetical protein